MFGIDIRWAGVFVAALLVVLLSAPALLRRAEAPPGTAAPASIPARIVDGVPANEPAGTAQPPARPAARAEAPPHSRPSTRPRTKRRAPASAPVILAEAPAEDEKSRPPAGALARQRPGSRAAEAGDGRQRRREARRAPPTPRTRSLHPRA